MLLEQIFTVLPKAFKLILIKVSFFCALNAAAYERGKAINMASFGEIDEVIDPKDSRRWIMAGLNAVPKSKYAQKEGRAFVDTW